LIPGVARYALTPGYSLSRLRRETFKQKRRHHGRLFFRPLRGL